MPDPSNATTFTNPLTPLLGDAAPPRPWTTRASTALTRAASTVGEKFQQVVTNSTPALQRAATQTKQAVTAAAQATAAAANKFSEEAAKTAHLTATQAAYKVMGIYELKGQNSDDLLNKLMHKLTENLAKRTQNQEWEKQVQARYTKLQAPLKEFSTKLPRSVQYLGRAPIVAELTQIANGLVPYIAAMASTSKNPTGSYDLSGFPELFEALKQKFSQTNSILVQYKTNECTKVTMTNAHNRQESFYIMVTNTERGIGKKQGILEKGWRKTGNNKEQSGTFTPYILKIPNATAYPEKAKSNKSHVHQVAIGSFFSEGSVCAQLKR